MNYEDKVKQFIVASMNTQAEGMIIRKLINTNTIPILNIIEIVTTHMPELIPRIQDILNDKDNS